MTLQDLNNIEKDQFVGTCTELYSSRFVLNDVVDVLAIVKEIGEVGSITTKAGKAVSTIN